MTRRARVPLLVLAAGLVAACVPVTPPPPPPPPQPVSQYCAPSTPNSAAAYQAAFRTLSKTYTEWATADAAVPVRLGGSRTLWLFSDTYIGKVSSSGAVLPGARLVSNSAVIQTGRCFKPIMGGAPLARSAWIPDPPGANQAYWPTSAVVDAANDRLYVLLMHVVRHPGSPLVSGLGTRIARFRASTLAPLGVTGKIPGTSELRPYGSTAFQDGGMAYLYSSNGGNFHLARAPVASVTNQANWEYWTGPGDVWSAPGAFGTAVPLEFAVATQEVGPLDVGPPIAPLRVVRHGDGFLGTAMKIDGITRQALGYTAPTPFGPWTDAGVLATTPSNVRSYAAQTLLGLQGGTPPILTYSTNLLPGQTTTTISNYGIRFVPVALPAVPTAIAAVPDAPTSPSTVPIPTTTTLPPSTLPPSTLPPTSTTTSSTTTTAAPPP